MENRTAPLVQIKKQFMVHKFVNHYMKSLNQQKRTIGFCKLLYSRYFREMQKSFLFQVPLGIFHVVAGITLSLI